MVENKKHATLPIVDDIAWSVIIDGKDVTLNGTLCLKLKYRPGKYLGVSYALCDFIR